MAKKRKCNCHLHDRQVCNICQKVSGKGGKDVQPMTEARKQLIAIFEYMKEMYSYDPVFIGADDEAEAYLPAIVDTMEILIKTKKGCHSHTRICYDYNKLIECMMRYNKWTHEEAIEWYDYNTARSLPYIDNAPAIYMEKPWM
jgi:hypothetical protein